MPGKDHAGRPGRVGRANERAGVARVAHVVQDENETLRPHGVHRDDRQSNGGQDWLRGRRVGDLLQDPRGE